MSDLQLYAIGFFLLGLGIGLALGVWWASQHKDSLTGYQRGFISSIVMVLWSVSMAVDIYNGLQNTPLFLHLFMGAVIGSINHEFGEWLIKLINRK